MNSLLNKLLFGLLVLLSLSAERVWAYYDPGVQRWINRDPINEAGGINLYAYVANRTPNRIDPFGLSVAVEGECPGTPKDKRDNCYQYACGTKGKNSDIPGASKGQRIDRAGCDRQDCAQVEAALRADGADTVPPDGKCPAGTHKIGFAAGNGQTKDPHFFRQSNDGKSWCHKFRGKDPSNDDGSGNPITDPQPGDIFNFGNFSYKFCGFLCAPDSAK